MNVLVACEYSGRVREAFRKAGHNALSCDLLESEDSSPYHYQGDCLDLIEQGWDMIIMHPPCTALAVSGNRWYGKGMERQAMREEAVQWTVDLWNLACAYADKVCMENPVGVLTQTGSLPQPHYIQPWQFGHGETKKTGLWLYNLPPLQPDNIVEGRENKVWLMAPSLNRWKERSRTYQGVADAMARQWG